jgi:hypothetical protein
MKMKISFWKFFGFVYLMNEATGEIHDLKRDVKHCCREAISRRNRRWLTGAGAERLLKLGDANGCRWCFAEADTDGEEEAPPRTRPGTRPGV